MHVHLVQVRLSSLPWRPLDDESLDAWRAFLNAHAHVTRRIGRDLAEAGLPDLGWYDLLWTLYGAPGRRLRVNEVAREVVLSPTAMSRFVDRAEAAGVVRREPDPDDRRALQVVLTDEGVALLRKMWPVYERGIERALRRAPGRVAGAAAAGARAGRRSRRGSEPRARARLDDAVRSCAAGGSRGSQQRARHGQVLVQRRAGERVRRRARVGDEPRAERGAEAAAVQRVDDCECESARPGSPARRVAPDGDDLAGRVDRHDARRGRWSTSVRNRRSRA